MVGATPRPALPVLTSLRFFAAAVVVAGHLQTDRIGLMPQFLRGWFQSGYEAVSFFFVLSGFILVYVYSGAREQDGLNVGSSKFLAARFARIGPAYYLALVLLLPSFVYGFWIANITPIEHFAPALILVPTLLQAWYPPVSFTWNGPAWSLSVELFFYLLFPLLLAQTQRFSRAHLLLLAAASVVVMAGLRMYIFSLDPDDPNWRYFTQYFPIFHLPSFVFGMALGRQYLFGRHASPATHKLLFLTSAAALMLLLGFRASVPPWVVSDALLVPLYGCVIWGATRMGGFWGGMLAIPALVLFGEASYSIYILHTAVIFWWRWVTQKILVIELDELPDFGIVFALVTGLSVLVFLFFERPWRRRILAHYARLSSPHARRVEA